MHVRQHTEISMHHFYSDCVSYGSINLFSGGGTSAHPSRPALTCRFAILSHRHPSAKADKMRFPALISFPSKSQHISACPEQSNGVDKEFSQRCAALLVKSPLRPRFLTWIHAVSSYTPTWLVYFKRLRLRTVREPKHNLGVPRSRV